MNKIQRYGSNLLQVVEDIGLFIIAIATVIAIGIEVTAMVRAMTVTLADLLILFIYLEVLAMVAIYLQSGKLPIRIPIYIAIVALARYLILDIKGMDTWRMLGVSASAMILAITVLLIRYGHVRLPYPEDKGK